MVSPFESPLCLWPKTGNGRWLPLPESSSVGGLFLLKVTWPLQNIDKWST